MILFISSPFDGGLFRLDTTTGEIERFQQYHGTGLCRRNNFLYQVIRGNSVAQITLRGEIQQTWDLGEMYYHDLFLWGNGFGLVNTQRSWVERYSANFELIRQFPEIYPGASAVDDACHFNSAYLYKDVLYGCCLRMSDQPKAYRKEDTQGTVFSYSPEITIINNSLHRPHSVRPDNEGIRVCDSRNSALVLLDYSGAELSRVIVETEKGNQGFSRGLLKVDGGWMVGLSSPRHGNRVPNWVTGARVVYVNTQGELVASWELPCFEIYDIVAGD